MVSRASSTLRRRNGEYSLNSLPFVVRADHLFKLLEVSCSSLALGRAACLILILCLAHGGSYSIYYALAVASHEIKVDHMFVSYCFFLKYGTASVCLKVS